MKDLLKKAAKNPVVQTVAVWAAAFAARKLVKKVLKKGSK